MGAPILQDLVIVTVVAAAATIAFYRLKLPLVLGYLLAGFIVGPFGLKGVAGDDSIHSLADLGLILLMFAVGLEFNFKKLKKIGIIALVAAPLEVIVMMFVGVGIANIFGWSSMDGIFLGAAMSISSTTIVLKVLMDLGKIQEDYAGMTLGILIVEDVLAVLLIVMLTGVAHTGHVALADLGAAAIKVGLFVLIAVSLGIVIVPRLIEWVHRFKVEEVLVITVIGLAFASALIANASGFSLATGAFLMGALIAESRAVRSVEHKIVPIRDLFSAIFFVAVGMLIDPAIIMEYWLPILIIALATVVGKIIACTVGVLAVGTDPKDAFRVGLAMGQIGEFSFIIAGVGLATGAMSPFIYPIAVAVCAITTLVSPFFIRSTETFVTGTSAIMPGFATRISDGYASGLARVRSWREGRSTDTQSRTQLARVVLYAAWFLGLAIAAGYLSLWVTADVNRTLTMGENVERAIGLLLFGLVSIPLLAAFSYAAEDYSRHFTKARSFDPDRLMRAGNLVAQPRTTARIAAGVAGLALMGIAIRVSWGVHPIALPSTWLAGAVFGFLILAGILAWNRLRHVYHWMEATLNTLLGHEELGHERLTKLRERYPWGVEVEEIPIRPHSWGAYTSIRDLGIREKTGVTVLSVERGASSFPSPDPDFHLLPQDRVVMMGKKSQLDEARHLLEERGAPPVHERSPPAPTAAGPTRSPQKQGVLDDHAAAKRAFHAESVRVPPSSPAVGARLGDVNVRERTGATLAQLTRNGREVPPGTHARFEANDRVLLVGPMEDVQKAKRVLGVNEPRDVRRN